MYRLCVEPYSKGDRSFSASRFLQESLRSALASAKKASFVIRYIKQYDLPQRSNRFRGEEWDRKCQLSLQTDTPMAFCFLPLPCIWYNSHLPHLLVESISPQGLNIEDPQIVPRQYQARRKLRRKGMTSLRPRLHPTMDRALPLPGRRTSLWHL